MNQQFNLSRFGLMLKLYWAENGRYYLLSFGLTIGVMLLLMMPIVGPQSTMLLYGLHTFAFLGGVSLGGCLFTNTAFAALSSPQRGIASIMVPASRLEKFAPVLLISLLGSGLVFVIGLQLHYGIVDLANQQVTAGNEYNPIPPEVLRFFGHVYFILQGAIFLGSLYFTKNSLIKSLGTVLVITIVAFVFNLVLAYHFTGYSNSVNTFPFTFWDLYGQQHYTIFYPSAITDVIRIFLGLIVVALVSITYVRLQEKEI